jgi:tRNA modification GTPase
MNIQDTIAASATPAGRSAIAVIRISGDECRQVISKIFKTSSSKPLSETPRFFSLGTILDPSTSETIDQGMAVFFAGPSSYTGEDMAEISSHGNPLIIERIMTVLNNLGIRTAEPGEFTYRAFLNGKMDLTQAEAVNALANAVTTLQAYSALEQMEGSFGEKIREWKDLILGIISRLEADIEFSDDTGDRFTGRETLAAEVRPLLTEVDKALEGCRLDDVLGKGADVVIAGRTNTGKSTLFNLLVHSERAIVTEIPGTTRDVITETIEIDGLPVRLHDTAGLKEYETALDREGVSRARRQISGADLIILMLDASSELTGEDFDIIEATKGRERIIVWNKADLDVKKENSVLPPDVSRETLKISALKGDGIADLKHSIASRLGWNHDEAESVPILHSGRQKDLLIRLHTSLEELLIEINGDFREEIASIHLHNSLKVLDDVLGMTSADEIYDRIFSQFCIGK